ncbi:MAG: pro-sigmaK processing inhibitor BofA family protein [Clostridia bacterium]|nr:pro-sigmaK processing inhibitor BofA family protein [Clostridia bacterium]
MEYLIFVACIVAVVIIAKIFSWPFKLLIKLVVNILLGGIMLFALNFLGAMIGITLPINWITATVAGLLGLPGVILLIIFSFIF